MGLGYDPVRAVAVLAKADQRLAKLMRKVGPCELMPRVGVEPFQALLRSIVYQQLSGKAAQTIHDRVLALFPEESGLTPERLVAVPDEMLRGAGLSRAKLAAIRDLAAKTAAGVVPPLADLHGMEDEAIVERLTAVRGVGRWTVEMLLMFYLGRPDVLPVADLGVRKGFMLTYGLAELPSAKALAEHGERWRPYRSVASWYLWRAVDGAVL
ncbi:MAG: DNA-3-methyladenine glycosylase [Gammaproteobacteria bacterium]